MELLSKFDYLDYIIIGGAGFIALLVINAWQAKRRRAKRWREEMEIRDAKRHHADWERMEIDRRLAEQELKDSGVSPEAIGVIVQSVLFRKGIR